MAASFSVFIIPGFAALSRGGSFVSIDVFGGDDGDAGLRCVGQKDVANADRRGDRQSAEGVDHGKDLLFRNIRSRFAAHRESTGPAAADGHGGRDDTRRMRDLFGRIIRAAFTGISGDGPDSAAVQQIQSDLV